MGNLLPKKSTAPEPSSRIVWLRLGLGGWAAHCRSPRVSSPRRQYRAGVEVAAVATESGGSEWQLERASGPPGSHLAEPDLRALGQVLAELLAAVLVYNPKAYLGADPPAAQPDACSGSGAAHCLPAAGPEGATADLSGGACGAPERGRISGDGSAVESAADSGDMGPEPYLMRQPSTVRAGPRALVLAPRNGLVAKQRKRAASQVHVHVTATQSNVTATHSPKRNGSRTSHAREQPAHCPRASLAGRLHAHGCGGGAGQLGGAARRVDVARRPAAAAPRRGARAAAGAGQCLRSA